jgi:hypothetical protein
MKFNAAGLMLCTFLVACGSSPAPFGEETETETETTEEDEGGEITGISRDGIPPGTDSPSPEAVLFRSEPTEELGGNLGDGFATGISYDGDTDTFTVDNLAFDGGNTYQRGAAVSSLNGGAFNVYEADAQYPDAVTGDPINQFTHRAIYGVSRNTDASGAPTTQFAIVRTGAFVDFGFGGFIYQRDTSVSLPQTGQAVFRGSAAGLRDFSGAGGVQYSTGDMEVAIDFEDFNNDTGQRGDAVRGTLSNRRVFDVDGNDITTTIVTNISSNNDATLTGIPDASFKVGPGSLDANGEAVGEINSQFVNDDGDLVAYEEGLYYAIVSGDDPDEIVGVMVLTNDVEGAATVRDTSGFIVYRD